MRALYFDLDGTLLHIDREYEDLVVEAFRRVTGTCESGWVDAYEEAFRDRFQAQAPYPYRQAFATGHDAAEALETTLLELEIEAAHLPAHAHADLAVLSKQYELGVLSNGVPGWQREKLRAAGLSKHIDAVVTSYAAGAHKPASDPFILAEAKLPAEEYGMVGDSETDVTGAQRQGWAACRYRGQRFRDIPKALGWS